MKSRFRSFRGPPARTTRATSGTALSRRRLAQGARKHPLHRLRGRRRRFGRQRTDGGLPRHAAERRPRPGQWVGRPPPLAPEDLYTGPRSDGLLSTDEISGDYRCCYFPFLWPFDDRGAARARHDRDVDYGLFFFPAFIGPMRGRRGPDAQPGHQCVSRPADPGPEQNRDVLGRRHGHTRMRSFKKRRDLAETGLPKGRCEGPRGQMARLRLPSACAVFCLADFRPFSALRRRRSTRTSTRSRDAVVFCVCRFDPVESRTHTRKYVNGHPTNGFAGRTKPTMSSGIATPAAPASFHLSSRRRSASPDTHGGHR